MRYGPLPRLCLCLLLVAICASAQAGGLSAELDRERVGIDETLTLRLVADGDLAGEPDLAPLEKDFEILSRGTRSSMSIVNAAVSHTREWDLVLAPRRVGRLTIPAIRLGAAQSRPVVLEVTDVDRVAPGGGPKPLFLDTRAETKSPYIQQGFVYRVRVLYRDQPRRATLSEPAAEGATIEQMGEDQSYSEMVDGQRYTAIERRFRVVPQRSGPLTIRGPRLEALVPDERPGARRSPFADFDGAFGGQFFQGFPNLSDLGASRRVVERGPDLTVDVRAQPAGTGPDWLPAESIQLTDEWTPSPPHFRVGEAISRTLIVTAQGTIGAALPTLDPGAPDGVKIYPEPPRIEDLPGSGSPTALKTLKLALVPTRTGSLTLPEIRLPWWDTVEDRARVAVIPQRTVQVEPAADGATSVEPQPQPQAGPEAQVAPAGQQAEAPSVGTGAGQGDRLTASGGSLADPGGTGHWPWIALLLGLGWLATLVWHWRSRRVSAAGRVPAGNGAHRRAESLRSARTRVRQACLASDPRGVRTALLAWGRARWRGDAPHGLGELAVRLGGAPSDAILTAIDRANYAAAAGDWDGPAAWGKLKPLLLAAERPSPDQGQGSLPELYPRPSGL